MIVLNEHEWAADMISQRSLGKKPFETARRVARYYIDQNISKKNVRKMMDSFLIQCDPTASLPKWSDMLDRAVSAAAKYEAINISGIDITVPEMELIDALPGRQDRRLAFTLLCLAKYWDTVTSSDGHWVNSKDSDIMRMANINTSIKRQSLLYHNLNQCGMIQFSKKVDNTNVRVLFMRDGEVALSVSDFRNLGYQYLKYHGEPYFFCENCGITTKYSHPENRRGQKYCASCAVEVAMQQNVNAVMRYRSKRGEEKGADNQRKFIVYMHTTPCAKKYIGVTSTSLADRWKRGSGYTSNERLYLDIQKYGWDKIKHYKILETTDENLAREAESFYIQKFQTFHKNKGFNRVTGEYVHGFRPEIQDLCTIVEVDGDGNAVCS